MRRHALASAAALAVTALAVTAARAQSDPSAQQVVVTATREAAPAGSAPMALDVVDADALRERNPLTGVAALLARVPGLFVHDRVALAQESTIALRGFGARAAFGVRGVRLLVDGLPISTPDGQGGTAQFDLASADRIEVLRGPFSALYGNHAAGVLQVFTREAPQRPELELQTHAGEGGAVRVGLVGGGRSGAFDAVVSASELDSPGWRAHSSARQGQMHGRLRWQLGESTTLSTVLNAFEQPESLDPLGLSAAQMAEDPAQANPAAEPWRTRRVLRSQIAGVLLDHRDAAGWRWHAALHGASRGNRQWLAFGGSGPTSAGGVAGFERRQSGLDLRLTLPLPQASLTLGLASERASDERRGWVNVAGETGELKRDETDAVRQTGAYAQLQWQPAERWQLHAGLRRSSVRFDATDRYITAANPDDSGHARYAAWTPAIGLLWRWDAQTSVYANAGRSFETPTYAELAYRGGGATGLNFELRPSTSRHLEAGLRGRHAGGGWRITAFAIRSEDEIVVDSAAGGRTVYRNADATRRHGLEASADAALTPTWSARVAATWLRARFDAGFTTPAGPVAAGSRLPGVPEATLFAELDWAPAPAWSAALELQARGDVMVDDRGSEAAPGAGLLALRLAWTHVDGPWTWRVLGRLDNLADRRWASAVYVNDGNGRYYAPGAPRSASLGVTLAHRWR